MPSGNIVTTADELSRFFELLRCGGELDGVRVMEGRTIRRAIVERAYRELDLVLGAPLRYSAGFTLGAEALSLFGPDTDEAFGHLGFTNVLAWADPERRLSVGLITSGKPMLHPGLPLLWALTRRIGLEAPKARRPALIPEEVVGPLGREDGASSPNGCIPEESSPKHTAASASVWAGGPVLPHSNFTALARSIMTRRSCTSSMTSKRDDLANVPVRVTSLAVGGSGGAAARSTDSIRAIRPARIA